MKPILAVVASFAVLALACSSPETATPAAAADGEPVASREADLSADRAAEALRSLPERGRGCELVAIVANPVLAPHHHDPNLQQTVGAARFAQFSGRGTQLDDGVALATITGKTSTGLTLANHHFVTPRGVLRTLNDEVALTPTADPCKFDATVKVNFVDGTRAYEGLSGTGVARASLDFCGAPGRAVVYGRLCATP